MRQVAIVLVLATAALRPTSGQALRPLSGDALRLSSGQASGSKTPSPTLEQLLERLSIYLLAYEDELSTVVADETYEQRTTVSRVPITVSQPAVSRRKLQSTISFMRLPGGSAWLGMREVRSVDNKAIAHSDAIQALLAAKTDDALLQAVDLAKSSGQYNLGGARTINMPTLPLELLSARNRERMKFQMSKSESVRGVRTVRIEFHETRVPTLIRGNAQGRSVLTRGTAWIERESGALWRAEVFYRDHLPTLKESRAEEAEIKVEFARHNDLGLLVPTEMKEVFAVPFGIGEGTARYSNFRRFSTSARIIPQ